MNYPAIERTMMIALIKAGRVDPETGDVVRDILLERGYSEARIARVLKMPLDLSRCGVLADVRNSKVTEENTAAINQAIREHRGRLVWPSEEIHVLGHIDVATNGVTLDGGCVVQRRTRDCVIRVGNVSNVTISNMHLKYGSPQLTRRQLQAQRRKRRRRRKGW